MNARSILRPAPWILGLALAACQQAENLPSAPAAEAAGKPATAPAMSREIQAAKQHEKDPVRLDAAIRDIMIRHGYAVSAPETPSVAGNPAPDGTGSAAEAREPSLPASGPLGKSAATTKVWFTVKSFDFTYPRAFQRSYTLTPGKSLTAVANTIGTSDPILVAYSRTSGTLFSKAFTAQILAFNDDRDSSVLDARIKWVNNTIYTHEVVLMAFAQNTATTGQTHITVTGPTFFPEIFLNTPISARPVFNNIVSRPIGGCTGPSGSRIQLAHVEGGGSGSGILAVNARTDRGGVILENGPTLQTLVLEDVLPVDGVSFLMGFIPGPRSITASRFTGIQQNLYTCLIP